VTDTHQIQSPHELQNRVASAFGSGPLLSATPNLMADALRGGNIEAFAQASPLAACLIQLLQGAGWRGSVRDISEALPHFVESLDLTDLQNVLARLGLRPSLLAAGIDTLTPALFPVVVSGTNDSYCVFERIPNGFYRVFSGAQQLEEYRSADELSGRILALDRRLDIERPEPVLPDTWVNRLAFRFKDRLGTLFLQSAMINICALAAPIIVMIIYDFIIPSKNLISLGMLMVGALGLMIVQAGMQTMRTRLIAHIGARVEAVVANATFGQILHLPAQMTETVPVGQQAARIREFDSLREIFSGQTLTILLELPFLLLFIGVIWWLGGPMAWIPAVMIALYAVVGASLWPGLRRAVRGSAKVRAKRHGALIDMISKIRAIKQLNAEHIWRRKMAILAANAAHLHLRNTDMQQLVQNFAQGIMALAGVATLAFGVLRVIAGDMTVGALIAIMALVWRVLAPLQNAFLTLGRYEQMSLSMAQVNQLMRLQPEFNEPIKTQRVQRRLAGGIEFQRVSFRYAQSPDPALLAIGMKIIPGELVALVGGNGAGKTTVLNLLLGLYRPQAGQILLDGVDSRQIDPLLLRRTIGYVPQKQNFFYGTIAQNLRLGDPTVSDAELQAVCARLGILDRVQGMKDGFETRIGDQSIAQHNVGFLQSLSIARALLRKSSILLMDEPAQGLDGAGDKMLTDLLAQMRGKVTVLMVTHRPSHVKLADKVVVMDRGQVVAFGPPSEVLGGPQKEMVS
jgi:ATP-binding cassette, subfamily C, bacterial LapB